MRVILHITTERNKDDLEWLQQMMRVEQVVYDKRHNNLDWFIKTEIRKYAAFSHLILDSNIFNPEDSDIEEFIRSISYLCSAYIGIIGDDIAEIDLAGVNWFSDIEEPEDRRELLRWIEDTAEEDEALDADESSVWQDSDTAARQAIETPPGERVVFFKKRGYRIVLVSLDEYDQSLALALANALASWGAKVSYSLISRSEERLQQLVMEHPEMEEIEGGYHLNGVDYYLNAADDDAHFVVFDMEDMQMKFLERCQADRVFFYAEQGVHSMEALIPALQAVNGTAEVLFINLAEEDQEAARQMLGDENVKLRFIASNALVKDYFDQEALREMPLDEFFIMGKMVS